MSIEKLHVQAEYVQRLDPEIRDSLLMYTINDYHEINRYHRKLNSEITPVIRKHIENIEQAFALCPTVSESFTVYRGQETSTFNTDSYISTTFDINITPDYFSKKNRCCIFVITVSPGAKALPLQNVSNYKGEQEVLLDKNGQFFFNHSEEDDIVLGGKTYPMRLVYVSYMGPVIQELETDDDFDKFDTKQEIQEDIFVNDVFKTILSRMTDIIPLDESLTKRELYDYASQAYNDVRTLIGDDKLSPLDRKTTTDIVNAYLDRR